MKGLTLAFARASGERATGRWDLSYSEGGFSSLARSAIDPAFRPG